MEEGLGDKAFSCGPDKGKRDLPKVDTDTYNIEKIFNIGSVDSKAIEYMDRFGVKIERLGPLGYTIVLPKGITASISSNNGPNKEEFDKNVFMIGNDTVAIKGLNIDNFAKCGPQPSLAFYNSDGTIDNMYFIRK
ncbi:MAG: hypothetical protein PHE25_05520 [Candidatus Gracilibacteria bacterium]|nr:hypothetical protein [Candidatus Gracilibacteria bacterium]